MTPQRRRAIAEWLTALRSRLVTGWARTVVMVLLVSLAFGMGDEQLTRLGGSYSGLADLANSVELWAAWPVFIGLVMGGWWRSSIAGGIGTLIAVAAFYSVHVGGGWGRVMSVLPAWLPMFGAVGAVGGLVGAGLRAGLVRLGR